MTENKIDSGSAEETEMDQIITAMMEHLCDHLCRFPWETERQEDLEAICTECKMGQYVCDISNTYNKLNDFEKSSSAALMKKYAGVVFCDECEYCKTEKSGIRWCRLSQGLDMDLKPGTGCTMGRKRETVMSKGFIVVEMPAKCSDCSFSNPDGDWCPFHGHVSYLEYDVMKPRDCPIHPLPGKKDVAPLAAESYVSGWNDCIDSLEN